jgi:hypothetical protein
VFRINFGTSLTQSHDKAAKKGAGPKDVVWSPNHRKLPNLWQRHPDKGGSASWNQIVTYLFLEIVIMATLVIMWWLLVTMHPIM